MLYSLQGTGGHTDKRNTSTDTRDTTATPGHCAGQHSRPIIIRYIRVQHTANHASGGGVSTDQRETRADPAHLLPWYYTKRKPGGEVQQRGTAGGAEPMAATAVSLFGLSPDS